MRPISSLVRLDPARELENAQPSSSPSSSASTVLPLLILREYSVCHQRDLLIDPVTRCQPAGHVRWVDLASCRMRSEGWRDARPPLELIADHTSQPPRRGTGRKQATRRLTPVLHRSCVYRQTTLARSDSAGPSADARPTHLPFEIGVRCPKSDSPDLFPLGISVSDETLGLSTLIP